MKKKTKGYDFKIEVIHGGIYVVYKVKKDGRKLPATRTEIVELLDAAKNLLQEEIIRCGDTI